MVSQFLKFLVIGCLNTLSQYLLFSLFLLVSPQQLAYTFAYGLAIIGSYLLNSRFTYQQRYTWSNFWRFTGVLAICQLGVSNVIFLCLQQLLPNMPTLTFVVTTTVMVPVSFFLIRVVLKQK